MFGVAFTVADRLFALAYPHMARRLRGDGRQRDDAERRERRAARLLARRTWRYFEAFIGPDDNWLAPDNYQEEPKGEIARRTSPTNLGLALLSTQSWANGLVRLSYARA